MADFSFGGVLNISSLRLIIITFFQGVVVEYHGLQGVKAVIVNSSWLLADKVLRLVIGLWVGVWVARHLGPDRFGLFNYAIAFVGIVSIVGTMGLDSFVIRDVVREPEKRDEILGTAFVLKVAGSVLGVCLCLIGIAVIRPHDQQVFVLVGVISLGSLFQAFDVIDFWYQSQVMAKYVVYPRSIAFLACSVLKVVLIITDASLLAFAWVGTFELVAAAAGLLASYWLTGGLIYRWRASMSMARHLAKCCWPATLSGISVMIYMRIDQVMLGSMSGERAVGIYSAALRLSEVWYVIPAVIIPTVFPSLVKIKFENEALYYQRLQQLFALMTALAILIALPMTFLSGWIVSCLFGVGYERAATVLSIHIWTGLFVFLGMAQSPWDVTENLVSLALVRTSMGAVINIVLNLVLIPQFAEVGAAIATVISQAFSASLLNMIHRATRPIFFLQIRSLLFVKLLHDFKM